MNFPVKSLKKSHWKFSSSKADSSPAPSLILTLTLFCISSFIFTDPLGVEEKLNPLEWTWVELAVDQTVDVVVCMMYSPGEFYCHVLQEDGKWTPLIYFFLQIQWYSF